MKKLTFFYDCLNELLVFDDAKVRTIDFMDKCFQRICHFLQRKNYSDIEPGIGNLKQKRKTIRALLREKHLFFW